MNKCSTEFGTSTLETDKQIWMLSNAAWIMKLNILVRDLDSFLLHLNVSNHTNFFWLIQEMFSHYVWKLFWDVFVAFNELDLLTFIHIIHLFWYRHPTKIMTISIEIGMLWYIHHECFNHQPWHQLLIIQSTTYGIILCRLVICHVIRR